MTQVANLTLVFLVGCGLGLLYFGGLWLTVRRVARLEQPGLWLLLSSLLRLGLLMLGLLLLMSGAWERLALALLGFLLARTLLVSLVRNGQKEPYAHHP